MKKNKPLDYDSPWKEAIEQYFKEFMALFFPEIHADIDWSAGYEFLDTELQKIVRDADLGRRLADKLVKVKKTKKTRLPGLTGNLPWLKCCISGVIKKRMY